jgi:[ribosomal protein S18]-alanine N-acetyltransferase
MEARESIEIREMTRQDLEEVLQIEGASFPTPWSRVLFERELTTPFARSYVARETIGGKILGYTCFWLVDLEAHLLNLAVHPQHRNGGIGTLLLGYGIEYCRNKGVQLITLEVRRSNYRAFSLYRNFHFQPRGIRRRYYTDTGEDAVVMGLVPGETASSLSPV